MARTGAYSLSGQRSCLWAHARSLRRLRLRGLTQSLLSPIVQLRSLPRAHRDARSWMNAAAVDVDNGRIVVDRELFAWDIDGDRNVAPARPR